MRTEGRLTPAEIRRALAECMTLANIDEAMDWPEGTARRLRWGAGPDHLPFADTELGGVPIWFRATIEAWRATLPEPAPEYDEEDDASEDEPADEPDEPEEPGEPEEPEEPDPAQLQSGFELQPGQHVTANIHGRWRDAVVTHRDRATVAVDYNLDDTPLGVRRQRISIDRIRLPG